MLRTALVLGLLCALAAPASAFRDFIGTRPLGMGGASRAFAVGSAGPLLNPSGMSLAKLYHVEGDYGFSSRRSGSVFHGSVVDSTSAFNLAGGLYYDYHLAEPDGGPQGSGHEGGFALSLPFGEYVALGGTVKYFRLYGDDAPDGRNGGTTFDLGVTIRPAQILSLAFVGGNLRNLHNSEAPRAIAYGAALMPVADLVIAVDGVTQFTADRLTGRSGTSVMGGAEYMFAQRFGIRLGGGYDAITGNGYGAAGVSLLGQLGAIDLGVREDLFIRELEAGVKADRVTMAGVSLRLFVPANETQPQ